MQKSFNQSAQFIKSFVRYTRFKSCMVYEASPIFEYNHPITTSVLMPLSRLAGVSNFCLNSLLRFLLIESILSSQAILFQILLYAFFPPFPWSTLLPFPSYFNFHNRAYLGIDVSTHSMTIQLQTTFNYILNLHNNTHPITKNII